MTIFNWAFLLAGAVALLHLAYSWMYRRRRKTEWIHIAISGLTAGLLLVSSLSYLSHSLSRMFESVGGSLTLPPPAGPIASVPPSQQPQQSEQSSS